jgi:hypothetical protein
MKVALSAVAAGALVVAGTVLVGGMRSDQGDSSSDPGRNAALASAPPVAPAVPLAPPAPDASAQADQEAARQAEQQDKAKDRAQAAKKNRASSDSSGIAQVACTKQVTSAAALTQALSGAQAGYKICAAGNMAASRLSISKGGTPANPVQVIGSGSTVVKGITVTASNVVVAGFSAVGAQAPGISLNGSNITVRNNTVKHPTGGDYDGLRFFGKNLKILNNTITDINPDGSGAHADCMQTFATDKQSPASQNVLISGNKCQRIDNQCLIAEGPHSSAGDGSGQGTSSNISFVNNVCEVGASQATEIDDVQNVRVSGNTILGKPDKAFSFQNKSTGAVVTANKIASGIGYEVGMDGTSKTGYQGPAVGGGP